MADNDAENWIMIQNAGVPDFNALFLVGCTDKGGDESKIGKFGSGFKYAIAAALRMCIAIVIYLGMTRIRCITERLTVHGRPVYRLVYDLLHQDGQEERLATSLTTGYGALDWKGAWPIVREFVANAKDADPRNYLVMTGVPPGGREGHTRVFIEANEDVVDVYRRLPELCRDGEQAMFECDLGQLYPKANRDAPTCFYCKGMYVLSIRDGAAYHYGLNQLPINEARDASRDRLGTDLLPLLDACPVDIKMDILTYAIAAGERGVRVVENSLEWPRSRCPAQWARAFERAFPDGVLCTHSDIEYQSVKESGLTPVRVSRELYSLLSAARVRCAYQILRQELAAERQTIVPQPDHRAAFDEARRAVAARLPEVECLSVSFVRLPAREGLTAFIPLSRARGQYQFTETLLAAGREAIMAALIDAVAQTNSLSGRCDLRYENTLLELAVRTLGEEPY